MTRIGDRDGAERGGFLRTAASCCLLAFLALLCTAGPLAPPAAAAQPPSHARLQDHPRPWLDQPSPHSTCHDGQHLPFGPLPSPPVAPHVPLTDAPSPACRDAAFARIVGPAHDPLGAGPSVDLHRLQIQRT
ncbi:hypothetical protein [Streptomyces hoynatensis]|uniref:Uncharacterized protein n=1 Tax=Streptomyces hoynatensis TaxID=1141874 RepID=A0A3A9Z6G6_9ACTN|nr:hypothetical protein [Streptomyces hoynatensis]RKN43863.1 hypothetical protein D7294_09180 [Streptomyces hoynatensis]